MDTDKCVLDVTIWLGTIIEPTFCVSLASWRTCTGIVEFLGKVQLDRGWNWSRSSLGKIAGKSRRLIPCIRFYRLPFLLPFSRVLLAQHWFQFSFAERETRHYIFNSNRISVCSRDIRFAYIKFLYWKVLVWSFQIKILQMKGQENSSYEKTPDVNSNFNWCGLERKFKFELVKQEINFKDIILTTKIYINVVTHNSPLQVQKFRNCPR